MGEAITRQADDLCYAAPAYATVARAEAAERLFGGATGRPASATADLGRSFGIMKTFHKPYPTASEYTWNSAMCVTHRLVREHRIDHRDVERVEVTVMTKMLTYPGLAFAGPYENIDQARIRRSIQMVAEIETLPDVARLATELIAG